MNIIDRRWNYSPLHFAYEKGDLDLIGKLLDRGADINILDRNNKTVLHKAVDQLKPKIVKLVLERGADVNAED